MKNVFPLVQQLRPQASGLPLVPSSPRFDREKDLLSAAALYSWPSASLRAASVLLLLIGRPPDDVAPTVRTRVHAECTMRKLQTQSEGNPRETVSFAIFFCCVLAAGVLTF